MASRAPPWLWGAWLLLAPGAQANPALVKAQQALDQHQYKPAQKALEKAYATPGNDRATLLKILEQQGVVAGFLNQPDRAKAAFRALLCLDPKHALGRDYAPRVMDPYRDAQKWAENRPLLFDAVAPSPSAGPKLPLEVALTADPLKLGRKVRFHARADGNETKAQTVLLRGGSAKVDVRARSVEWWAELLGEHDATLAVVGSAAKPLAAAAAPPAPVARVEAPPVVPPAPPPAESPPVSPLSTADLPVKPPVLKLAPAPVLEPGGSPAGDEPARVEGRASSSTSTARLVSYGFWGGAVATGIAGGFLGFQANAARSKILNAPQDTRGVVTGMKQTDAYALDQTVRTDAPIANVLLCATAGFAATGVALWWVGRDSAAFALGPSGVSVVGAFP